MIAIMVNEIVSGTQRRGGGSRTLVSNAANEAENQSISRSRIIQGGTVYLQLSAIVAVEKFGSLTSATVSATVLQSQSSFSRPPSRQ